LLIKSEWTECSTLCDQGFKSRRKECTRVKNEHKQETISSQDWLCSNGAVQIASLHELSVCERDKCKIYDEWSTWSPCSKLCGGYKRRERKCSLGATEKGDASPLCEAAYLTETQVCGLDDCAPLVTSNMKHELVYYVNVNREN
jgi:hypothetical protein